jgi:membrane-associated protease RseP (regulator of RpoE activity)
VAALLTLATLAVSAGDETKQKEREKEIQKRERVWTVADGGAWLGVTIAEVDAAKAKDLKLPGEYGVLIEDVEAESPAAKAGLQKNDVILSFADERVRGVAHLKRLLRETPAGRSVSLQVSRAGRTQALSVTPEARRARWLADPELMVVPEIEIPAIPPVPAMPEFNLRWSSSGPRLGIGADELTPQLAEYFGVKQGRGVLVKEVMEGSAAAKAGLKAGDVIVRVGDDAIGDVGDLRRALRREREKNEVTLTIVRDRKELTLPVTLEPPARRETPRRVAWLSADPDARRELEEALRQEQEEMRAEIEQEARAAVEETRQAVEAAQRELQSQKFRQEMQRLQQDMQKMQRDLQKKFQSEEFRKQMEQLQRELQEELRRATQEDRRV